MLLRDTYLGCRCDRQAGSIPDPVVAVLEAGGSQGANRLDFPGCSLNTGWQVLPAEEGQEADLEVFVCEATLCGEAGALSLVVAEADADGRAIAAANQPLNLLPGAYYHVLTSDIGQTHVDMCSFILQAEHVWLVSAQLGSLHGQWGADTGQHPKFVGLRHAAA